MKQLARLGLVLVIGVVALPGHAQTLTPLHSFGAFANDGQSPGAALIAVGTNTLFGTTSAGGGNNVGTVFAIHTDGSGYTNLHEFGAAGDGRTPQSALTAIGDTLYGTTTTGGSNNFGTVFAINTNGADYTILHEFGVPGDGRTPEAGLIVVGATLYGTTYGGGTNSAGTVFSINADGSGYTTLYQFGSTGDGENPWAALTAIGARLFGTTYNGGAYTYGTIFAVNTNGANYELLYSFGHSVDGKNPRAPLLAAGGKLYGTTFYGGSIGDGTVFAIRPDGLSFTNLHQFETSGFDGQYPWGLTAVGSTFYGTTYAGGSNSNFGTVFALNTNGTGYATVYQFGTAKTPNAELTLVGSTFYGTTVLGGDFGVGTVFKLTGATGGGGGGGGLFLGTLSKVKQKCKTKKSITTCKLGAQFALLNSGQTLAPATHIRFFLSTDANYDVGVDTLLAEATTKTIKPSKTKKLKLKSVLNASATGFLILAVDDSDNVLATIQIAPL